MRPAKKQKSYFSKRLIELRNARGLTQEQLANELNLSTGTIAYYEDLPAELEDWIITAKGSSVLREVAAK